MSSRKWEDMTHRMEQNVYKSYTWQETSKINLETKDSPITIFKYAKRWKRQPKALQLKWLSNTWKDAEHHYSSEEANQNHNEKGTPLWDNTHTHEVANIKIRISAGEDRLRVGGRMENGTATLKESGSISTRSTHSCYMTQQFHSANEKHRSTQNLYKYVHNSIIRDSQKVETIKISINWINWNTELYKGILFTKDEPENITLSERRYQRITCNFIYMKCLEQANPLKIKKTPEAESWEGWAEMGNN